MPGYQGGLVSDFGLSRIKIMGIQKSIEEKIGSKMHREVKLLMYMKRSVFYTLANFCVERSNLRGKIFDVKCLFWRIEAGSRQPFYYIKTSRGGKNRRARERRSQESFHQSQEIFTRATCCKICNLKF